MAGVGTFEKCRKQIESGIKRQLKEGHNYIALDLPYFTKSDQSETDTYLKELEQLNSKNRKKIEEKAKSENIPFVMKTKDEFITLLKQLRIG